MLLSNILPTLYIITTITISYTMAAAPVALVLGAGANIGQAVGRLFAEKGYQVALVARSVREEDSTDKQLNIQADFADPASVVDAFAKVKAKFGVPTVVVHNGMNPRIYLIHKR